MLVSVVIPCYNSEHTIEKVVDLCVEEFKKLDGYELEMVLVNDYSKDNTFEAIRRCSAKYPNVIGVNLAKNFGQHSAMMAAFHYVHGDIVVGMDDDLQNHPAQIAILLNKMREGYDVVYGVYRKRHHSVVKNLYSWVDHVMMWHMIERPKGIEMNNYWMARRYVIDKVLEYEGSSPFIQLLFFRTTYNMANVDIEHYEREVGTSNYTFRKGLKQFLAFSNYSVLPLRLASVMGVLISFAGLLATIGVIIYKLTHTDVVVGWASTICGMLLLFGFLFLLLGIIGEYLGKIVLMENRAPQFVVRETLNAGEEDRAGMGEMPPIDEKVLREAE